MSATTNTAHLPLVDSEARGQEIRRRRNVLDMSVREMERRSGIPRGSISAAEHGTAGAGTYREIELWLSTEEAAKTEGRRTTVRPIGDPDERLIEVEVEGRGGFRMIVRGPVSDPEALADMAERLMRRAMSSAPEDETDRSATSE